MSKSRITAMQRHILVKQGCTFMPGATLLIAEETSLDAIHNVCFIGKVSIGTLSVAGAGIRNATIADCSIGDECSINNVHGIIQGADIADNVHIQNIGEIVFEPEAQCGLGVEAAVLDETGSRPVSLFPGLTAQIATLVSHRPKWNETEFSHLLDYWSLSSPDIIKRLQGKIGSCAVIKNCQSLVNVGVDHDVQIAGAVNLKNGMVVNNAQPGARAFAHVGCGVNAEDFIIEDGRVDGGAYIRRCYVGQCVVLDKGFTAHDSLFFANCAMECGEACAVLAGPYTVSMHKSSLLIGMQSSFMNAGSGTNFSNHMYKLGPIHWGILQRGVKTSSSSYVMWGARIGSFSLVMGQHKYHPDTTAFPFAYLFGNADGHTVVLPGAMLKSCGLARDLAKWPARDKRKEYGLPLQDNVVFDVFNPMTVGRMLDAFPILNKIEDNGVQAEGMLHYNGLLFKPSSISKARHFYRLGILKYLKEKILAPQVDAIAGGEGKWVDLGGQLLPECQLTHLMEADTKEQMQQMIDDFFSKYAALEQGWINANMARIIETLRLPAESSLLKEEIKRGGAEFDRMIVNDKEEYLSNYNTLQHSLQI